MKIYKLLKQNAPKVFKTYAMKRIAEIKIEIEELRGMYKIVDSYEKKEAIKNKGIELKKELEILNELLSLDNG